MPLRDLGVTPDYVDRAFRALDAEAATRSDPKGYLAHVYRRQRVQCDDLAKLQESRPLKPPGGGDKFGFVGPVLARVLEEKRRQTP